MFPYLDLQLGLTPRAANEREAGNALLSDTVNRYNQQFMPLPEEGPFSSGQNAKRKADAEQFEINPLIRNRPPYIPISMTAGGNPMAGEYLDPSQWPLWMQSGGMGPIPGSAPAQGVPEDPFERAAYTNRHGRPMAPTPDIAGPGEMAQGASMLIPGPGGLITRAPKLATGLLAGLGYLYGTDQAGAAEPDQIKQLQATLQQQGHYNGTIDGKMGPETKRALEAAQAAEARRVQQEQAAAQMASAGAQQATAQAQLAESQRQRLADETRAQQREQGNQRMQEVETNISPTSRAIRDYAGPIGYGVGAVAAPMMRAGVAGLSNAWARRAATGAEDLFATAIKGTSGRVARANEFARRGGAGEAVPFLQTPNTAPGFAANPGAATMASLFQPNKWGQRGTDAGLTAAFGGEAALGEFKLKPDAEAELHAATQAAAADPSEINIDRLQTAKNKLAVMEGISNIGRAGTIGYPAASLKFKRLDAIPNMSKAEKEILDLQALLRKKGPLPIPQAQAPMLSVGMPPAFAGAAATRARVR